MIRSTRDVRTLALCVGLLTLLGLFLGLGPASAHPLLISSSPQDGAVVATSPTSIAFRFHDEVGELADVSVWAPDGSVVTRREITTDFDTIIATFESSDQRGRYTAYYRATTVDGLPIDGTIQWTTTSGRKVKQVDPGTSSVAEPKGSFLLWGVFAAAFPVIVLMAWLLLLRERDDKSNA